VPDHDSLLPNWKPVPQPRPVTLRGLYVTLEPLDAARHSDGLWKAIRGHGEAWTWLGDGPYADEASLRDSLARKQSAPDAVFFALLPAETGEAAGYASYMRIEPVHGVVEVGNILFSPVLQRTRAATEVMYLMARHVFDDLGYRRYEWKCNTENGPSRRAALRLGFTFEGVFRQHMVVKGRSRDTAWFAMLDREWPARKRAFEAWLDAANFDAEGRQRQSLTELASPLA